MNTAITRIGFLLIPAALALALAPATAMADELQNGASSINSSHTEQTQEPLAGEASIGNDSTQKKRIFRESCRDNHSRLAVKHKLF